jgi:hypothetical protein
MPRTFSSEVRPGDSDRRMLGLSAAVAVFLVLMLVKFGAFFAFHPKMLHGNGEALGAASVTLADVASGGAAR